MKHKKMKLFLALLFGVGVVTANAQVGVNASGRDLLGPNGSISYSVGQVVYTTNSGSNGSVSQGVQQAFEIQVLLGVEQVAIKLNMAAYPNPTNDVLNLSVGTNVTSGMSYQLFDFFGRMIANSRIENEDTVIPMSSYPQANYLLNIIQDNKTIKTFKIIKK